MTKCTAAVGLVVAIAAGGITLARAQAAGAYRARLSPVPVDGPSMMATISGMGAATASLSGSKLTVTGSFEGLKSPATLLKIHRGIKGIRGPAVIDLQPPTHAEAGQFSATVELSAAQVDDLKRERFYLQLYSEKAPEGNLWGWLLPQENQR